MEEAIEKQDQKERIQFEIRMSKALSLFRQDLITKLTENKFHIQFGDLDPCIMEIPSTLKNEREVVGVFWLNHHSFKQLTLEIIFEKIAGFMEQYLVHILLLENFQQCESACEPSLMCGFWAYLALNWGCGCLPLRGEDDLVLCLISLAKREQLRDKAPSLARIKEKTESIEAARSFFLQGLINCGEKKAGQLLHYFKDPISIIQDLVDNQGRQIQALEGFGPRFVEDNCELLTKDCALPDKKPLDNCVQTKKRLMES